MVKCLRASKIMWRFLLDAEDIPLEDIALTTLIVYNDFVTTIFSRFTRLIPACVSYIIQLTATMEKEESKPFMKRFLDQVVR